MKEESLEKLKGAILVGDTNKAIESVKESIKKGIQVKEILNDAILKGAEEAGKLYEEDEQAREFNRYTLTGQWDMFFFALLRERLAEDHLDIEKNLTEQFKAHLNRGIMLLYQRLKKLEDLADIVSVAQKNNNNVGL